MRTSRLTATHATIFALLLAASPDCWAQFGFVYFDGGPTGLDTALVDAANWDPDGLPDANPDCAGGNVASCRILGIDGGFSATFSGGSTRVFALRVGSPAKENQFPDQETRFGQLTMTGGTLEVIGDAGEGWFGIGRERENSIFGGDYNKDSVVNAADYTVWRNTLGSMSDLRADGDKNGTIQQDDYDYWKARFGNVVKGGEIIMTGASTIRAYGLIVGERTNGLLSVGPESLVDLKTWVTTDEPPIIGPHFSDINTADLRIGNYGPAYFTFIEPGLDGRGLADVQGALNANTAFLSENGAKGEIRLSGGTVNLNGALIMSFCSGCVSAGTPANDAKLALQSSKVSISGSSGSFNVGLDPDPVTPDPNLIIDAPFSRDIRFNVDDDSRGHPETATFSFTADAGGVTPITVVDNGLDSEGAANLSGTAYIGGTNLELNLDAYAGTSPLVLIDAKPGNVSGTFGTVTFLGTTTATVDYSDVMTTGNVRLINFQNGSGAGAGALASASVPEPSGMMLVIAMGLFVFLFDARANRQRASQWGYQCATIRA